MNVRCQLHDPAAFSFVNIPSMIWLGLVGALRRRKSLTVLGIEHWLLDPHRSVINVLADLSQPHHDTGYGLIEVKSES
jgi:hypothetical protein